MIKQGNIKVLKQFNTKQNDMPKTQRDNEYTSKVAYLLDFWKEKRRIDVRLMSEYQKISGCPKRAAAFYIWGNTQKAPTAALPVDGAFQICSISI